MNGKVMKVGKAKPPFQFTSRLVVTCLPCDRPGIVWRADGDPANNKGIYNEQT